MSLAAYWQELPVCVCTQMRVDVGHCGCSSNRWQRSSRILTSWRLEWAEVVGVWESRVVAFKRRQLDFMCTVHSIRWPPQGGMYASWIGLGDSGVHLFFYFFRINDIDCRDYLDRKFPVFLVGEMVGVMNARLPRSRVSNWFFVVAVVQALESIKLRLIRLNCLLYIRWPSSDEPDSSGVQPRATIYRLEDIESRHPEMLKLCFSLADSSLSSS